MGIEQDIFYRWSGSRYSLFPDDQTKTAGIKMTGSIHKKYESDLFLICFSCIGTISFRGIPAATLHP
ncbi:hypothetical protein J2T02_005313 [Chitinophaga terrae (ex Kim and Jung 2007)]|nr:hypothetical protein [Chitinophaga terrae (ex Kim and Jung 2007)]